MTWDNEQAERWEKTRAKGMRHFILLRGVAGFGIFTAMAYTLFEALMLKRPFSMGTLVTNFIFFACAGALWGFLAWKYLESGYQKHLNGKN
jgi:hypothetical protein